MYALKISFTRAGDARKPKCPDGLRRRDPNIARQRMCLRAERNAIKERRCKLLSGRIILAVIMLCLHEGSHAFAQQGNREQWRVRTELQQPVQLVKSPQTSNPSLFQSPSDSEEVLDGFPQVNTRQSENAEASRSPITVGAGQSELTYQDPDSSTDTTSLPPTSAPSDKTPSRRQPRNAGAIKSNLEGERYRQFVMSETQAENVLTLFQNRPRLLTLRVAPIRTYIPEAGGGVIAIRFVDPDAATQIAIEPLAVGSTVLTMWFPNPDEESGEEAISWLINVTEDPQTSLRFEELLSSLEREINRAFPNSAVTLAYVGSQVVVRGQAKDVEESSQILRIVSASLPNGAEEVTPPLQLAEVALASAVGAEFENPNLVPDLIAGDVASGVNQGRINNRIVNLLEVAGVHQVMLKVTVAEVNRSAFRDISATMGLNGNRAGFSSRFKANTSPGSVINNIPLGGVNIAGGTVSVNAGDFSFALNALKQMNLAKSLAEPTLTTLNGQPANFRAGDTFPVPQTNITNGGNSQQVNQSFVGISVSFLPIVTHHNRIRLSVQGNVSTRDDQAGASIGGTAVPGTTTRDFQTNVEMREGETLALAGLINTSTGSNSSRVPFVGDIPGLGRFFAADGGSSSEQELIVLVTPYLVNPVDTNETPIALPGSDYFEPDDVEFFLKGSLTGHVAEDYRSPVRTDIHKMKAFRRCEQQMIIGQPGHSNGLLCPPANPNPMRQGVQQ